MALTGWAGFLLARGQEPARPVLVLAIPAVALWCAIAAGLRSPASAVSRRRTLQWLAAAAVMAAAFDVISIALHVLIGVPGSVREPLLASLLLVPAAQAALSWGPAARAAGRVLQEAVVLAGLAALAVVVYLVIVVGLGRPAVGGERDVLVSSILAAVVVAALAIPARNHLAGYGAALAGRRDAPAQQALATLGARMSRAVPMDELLLQLAESLRASMAGAGAEIWTGSGGLLVLAVSVPARPAARMTLDTRAQTVAGRALAGASWISMWLPELLDQVPPGGDQRIAPVAHLGELLGLVVVHRSAGDEPFGEDDERHLVDLARQLGLALHNVRLDSALQASLEELERRNAELQASRLRIVTASDEARRTIERNLHDGAQQHLVALAVRLGLASQIAGEDPGEIPAQLDELRKQVQTTIGELRELAHGIYPPLLRDRGLAEALRAAASRCPLACTVEASLPGRYPEEIETAAYFFCLEALQNAAKHAGAHACVTVRAGADETALWLAVQDDGAGFDTQAAAAGTGFMNMRDRLGAIGGSVTIDSAPGAGVTVRGAIPAERLGAFSDR